MRGRRPGASLGLTTARTVRPNLLALLGPHFEPGIIGQMGVGANSHRTLAAPSAAEHLS